MKKLSLSLLPLLFVVSAAQAKDYVTKKGDTLAKIARSYYGEPVFGPKGSIGKIYALNAWAKKAGSSLEPGQVVVLEDKEANVQMKLPPKSPLKLPPKLASPHPIAATVPVEKVDEASALPSPPMTAEDENDPSQIMKASHAAKCPEPTVCPVCAACPAQLPATPAPACPAIPVVETAQTPPGTFAFIPRYSLIKHAATDIASGSSYTVQSSQAFGAELAWDHWWNDSFSTVFMYSILQMSSNEKSDVSGAAVIDATILNRAEISFLNRLTHGVRFGLGAAYGDHLFLEQFTSVPNDPRIFKTSFWHPFAAAEWTMLEGKSFDLTLGLKIGGMPAQVGQGHDLSNGTEFVGNLDLLEKFSSWSILYGVNYSTSNQARINASQTTEEWTFKLGAMF